MALKVVRRKTDDLPGDVVQIQGFERELPLGKQRTQVRNHIGGAVRVFDRAPDGLACPVDAGRGAIQHPEARAGVGDDARRWLADLMGDRRGERAQGGHPRHPREFGARSVQGVPASACSRQCRVPRRRCAPDPARLSTISNDRKPSLARSRFSNGNVLCPLAVVELGKGSLTIIRVQEPVGRLPSRSASDQPRVAVHAGLR
jgi:hypothetical protein